MSIASASRLAFGMALPYKSRMRETVQLLFFLFFAGICWSSQSVLAWAQCMPESVPNDGRALVLHLGKACTEGERLAHAIRAEELLQAIRQGHDVDLVGVVIVGDLFLDQLPPVKSPSSEHVPAQIRELLTSRGVKELRVVPRPVSIRDSRFEGTVDTRLMEGYLLMQGPFTMAGTTFKEKLDLSRTLFNEPVDFSDATFVREAFFIQTVFSKPARFKRVNFGAHSRFHRGHFGDSVTFEQAAFNGLTEFLEVAFDKEARFSRSTFKMGTGFSGARFAATLDLSDALFEREVFFLFTSFAGDTDFRRCAFRGQVDFSDATFDVAGDFSTAVFAANPLFHRAKTAGPLPVGKGRQDSRFLYGFSASLLVLAVLFLWVFRTR